MRRDCEWVQRLDDGTKRVIRVSFPGGGKIIWMSLDPGEERWNRNMTPTPDEWEYLENKVRALYGRRRAGFKDVELVMAARQKMA